MNTRPRKWVKIATVDENGYGSFGSYVPFNPEATRFPNVPTITRIQVRQQSSKKRGKKVWVIWGVQA